MWYRGWTIKYWPVGAQHWKAERHGVGMCAQSQAAIKRMIDIKISEVRDNRK